jgi:DNA-binding phage protein/F0F1-type ATP synthase delta subunit
MAIEGAAIGVPIDAVLRTFGKMKANKVAQEQPAKVETPLEKIEPVLETPKPKDPFIAETPTPRSNKLPDVLIPPKDPRRNPKVKAKTVRSLLKNRIPKNDPYFEEIASALGYDRSNFPLAYTAKNAPVDSTGNVMSDVGEQILEDLDANYNFFRGTGKGFRESSEAGKPTELYRDDLYKALEKNDVLPEFEQPMINYVEALNKHEYFIDALRRAGINPNRLKGKTNKEVEDIVDEIVTFENVEGGKVSESFAARFDSLPPVESYADEITGMDNITSKTVDELDAIPPDFAGNINLKKIDAPNKVKNVIDDIAKNNDEFIEARRGVVKFGSDGEELAALAKETGLTEEQLINRTRGSAFNAETAYAARVLNVNSAENLVELAKKARSTKATAEDLIEFNQALTRHASIQEQVAGITAEAGRALRSFKEIAASKGAIQERLIKEYIQGKGGKENIESIAEAISKLDDPEQIARFSKEVYKATKLDQVQEAWINALLSSPSTHAVNILSNTLVAASRIPEYGIATVLGSVRKGQDKVTFTELGARILGNIYGTLDGLRMGSKAIIDPDSVVDPLTKLELQKQNAIPGVAGEIVRIPGRALVAEDTFFKAIGYRQELFGQAVRKAKQEGKGVERVFELIKDPKKNFPDAYSKGQEIARYQTFTNPLGSTGQAFQKIIANNQYLRFLAPFVRTPVNIVKYAAQRTPLGIFAKTYKEGIKKGGAEADLVRARVILGTSIMSAIAYLSNEGLVTGRGPSDPGKRTVLRETGWQPYSLKIDDTYYGYNRFEPAGILFGLAADTVDIYNYADSGFIKSNEGEIDELVSMIVGSATQNITNKTFMTGITDAINVISDPDRYGEKWINRFASTVVPTGVYYLRKGEDPLVRDAVTMADSISNRIPGKSDELPFKRNVFGEPIEYSKNYSPEFLGKFGKTFSPIQTSKEKQDVVFDEMNRLDITPNRPHRKIGGVDLNPVQYQGMLGEMLNLKTKQKLEFLIQSPVYKNALDSEKIDLIKEIIRQDQSVAREQTQIKYPQILTDQMLKQIEELNQ